MHQQHRQTHEKEYAQLVSDQAISALGDWFNSPRHIKVVVTTAIDYATGWPIAKAIADATEDNVADFIYNEIYMYYGAPQEIFTDGGKNLWGGVVQAYLKKIETQHRGTSLYHPRTYERQGRTIKRNRRKNARETLTRQTNMPMGPILGPSAICV
jgi:hypothetical protein